jgi:GT2 family glycosyltransferase
MKRVSVHVVTFNSGDCIEECLEAVVKQSYPIHEIVVIDNNSQDETWAKLSAWSDRVTIIKNTVNTGFAGAHNQAIRMTSSDYCLILNPDVALTEDYVLHLIGYMEKEERCGSAAGKLLLKASPLLMDSAGLVINRARRAFDRGAHCPADEFLRDDAVFGVSGAAAMYRREMIEEISVHGEFFDEDFFAYKEDVDVAWRAQLMGWTAGFVSSAVAYHERGWKQGGRSGKSLFIRRLSYINRYKMMFKNESIRYLAKHSLPILVYEILSLVYLLLREPKVLQAWISFFRELPNLKQKRKFIQGKRTAPYEQIYGWFK